MILTDPQDTCPWQYLQGRVHEDAPGRGDPAPRWEEHAHSEVGLVEAAFRLSFRLSIWAHVGPSPCPE